MIQINLNSPTPIYDQIKAGLKGLVAKGLLKPGDQAPVIRSLAVSLRVNPNTVARAFRELALEGFLESRRGDGTYISSKAKLHIKDSLEDVRRRLKEALGLAQRGGLDWAEIERLIKEAQGEEK